MATTYTFKIKPAGTEIYSGTSVDVHSSGTADVPITLNNAVEAYGFLLIYLNNGGTAGGRRGALLVPVYNISTPADWAFSSYGTHGSVRLSASGKTLTFSGCTFTSALYVTKVYGIL